MIYTKIYMTTRSYKGAICPHCNYLHKARDDDGSLYDEDTYERQCYSCDKYFAVRVYASHSWVCEKLDD